MTKWLYKAVATSRAVWGFFCGNRALVIAAYVCSVSLNPCAARAEEKPQSAASPAAEESLLIATREIAGSSSLADQDDSAPATSPADALEPIAQTSDYAPELAGNSGQAPGTSEIGETLIKANIKNNPIAANNSLPAASDPVNLEPVKFQGMLVGKSTKQDLTTAWGDPNKSITTPEGEVLAYSIHPFEAVEVLVGSGNVISAIKIALATPLESSELSKQLSLDSIRPATVKNDEDEPLGQVFPERGVLFMFDASDSDALAGDGNASLTVSHVVVQPLEAETFAMRVENCIDGPYSQNIADLKTALSLDAKCAHAHSLLAKIYQATGQADLADSAAAKACEVAPDNAAFQLCRAETQLLSGEYDASVITVRAVLDREEIAPIDKAQALYQLASLAALGDSEIASKAITLLTRAIEIADAESNSAIASDRRAAKRLLVDAHLAMAEEIARQSFNEKVDVLSLWVGRASGIAEDFITTDGGSVALRLAIAQRTLGALATFRPTLDPEPWISEAEEAAQALLAQSNDELWQTRVKWDLGIAYLNALRVEHVRRETASALQYGQKAVDCLAAGAASRQAVHSSEQLVGQLYFQMGAVYAVHELDHKQAVTWYNKAVELLNGPRPVSELYSPRREGEMLVSMGVTYWQLGEQARALQLTQSGVNLVEMAVEDGILGKNVLAVPYGNLAAMYKQIGESSSAAKYSNLAKSAAPPSSREVRAGRTRSPFGRIQQTNAQQSSNRSVR
jgi:tetratricopeptide (TPR) repeat protein